MTDRSARRRSDRPTDRRAPGRSPLTAAACVTFIASILTFVAVLLAPAVARAQSADGEVGPPIGSPAPAATLEDLDGHTVQLLGYAKKGKPALIEFWATWCENCAALQPQMDRIEKAYGDRLDVVGVDVAVAQTVRRVKRHVAEHDPGYPYLWDGDGTAVRAYNAPTTSVVVILDADGKVVYTGVGPKQDLVGAVRKVLGAN
jgi:thiol-disulfide isomerase/thioredoxin